MHKRHEHIGKDGFRLRGTEMSRIDGFSDVVFGFALTLIVVALEVPRTYEELHRALLGFPAFCICFLFLIMVWYAHYRFFRRCNTHDFATIVINSVLLAVVLLYMFMLKFLATMITAELMPHQEAGSGYKYVPIFNAPWQAHELMVLYGLGFAFTYFCLAALYANAWRHREALHLNALERTLTKVYGWDLFGVGCVGVLAAVVALLLPGYQAGQAGYVFFVIGIYKTVHGFVAAHHTRRARALCTEDDLTAHAGHGT